MDTIVAPATSHGIGAISIVRLSGDVGIAQKLINRTLKPRIATLCQIYSQNGDFIDEAIVIYFKAPHSFTGEDVVEFQTHGGYIISDLIIDELVNLGARIATPGEFSKRAFLNGKMDLSKAEAIGSLIMARSEGAAKILARNLRGDLERFVSTLRAELVTTLAYVETCIDYAEEDLPSDIAVSTMELLRKNYEKLNNIVAISSSRRGLIEGFKIAIIGKPNVGKSSILNSLLKFERAIVSDEAGTTRDLIEESLKIGSHLVRIMDTAGIRKGSSNIENIGILYSLRAASEADIILAVFDGSKFADEEDEKILDIARNSDKKVIYILNKCDLDIRFDKNLDLPLEISAKNGTDEIINHLKNYLNSQNYDGIMLSSNRQIIALKNAMNALKNAMNLLDRLELFAFEINTAIKEIASISRPFERSEILDEMFSHFCLGK